MSPGEVLREACTLLTPDGAWTQRHFAADSLGADSPVSAEGAVCFCALGALMRVTPFNDGYSEAHEILTAATGGHIPRWNDAPGRTQAEVVALLDRLATEHGA